jgi:membrane associated rhomboid family serine protease
MHAPFVKERRFARLRFWWSDLLSARVSLLLAGIMGLVHALVWTGSDPIPVLLRFGLQTDIWSFGTFWQCVTYSFIHGNGVHIALNLAGLLIIGPKVERIGGPAIVLKVFFAGSLIGGVAHLVLAPPDQRGMPLVGASGGIMALLLWLTTASPEARTWPIRISGRSLGRGVLAAEAGLLVLAWALPREQFHPVAHACHLGGAIVGWGMARRLLRPPPTLEDLQKERARRESADGPPSST